MLTNWRAVSNDLHQWYGIDMGDDEQWRRPWWWLAERIQGLLDVDSRLLALLRST